MAEKKEKEAKEEVTILDVRDIPSTEPGRIGKIDVLVTYQIDPAHVYMIRIPKEEFTEERLTEEIKRDVAEKRRWIGKKIAI